MSKIRNNNLLNSTITAGIAKASALLLSFLSVPLLYGYLGAEFYGIWVTINAAIGIMGFLDFGIGNSMINIISKYYNSGKILLLNKFILASYYILLLISTMVAFFSLIVYSKINLNYLENIGIYRNNNEIILTIIIATILLLINNIVSLIQKIQIGLGEGYKANIWQSIINVVTLMAIYVSIKMNVKMYTLILATLGMQIFILAISTINYFKKNSQILKRALKFIDIDTIKVIVKNGSFYFIIQIAGLLSFQIDILVIAKYLGAESVSDYSIALKYFSIPTVLISLYTASLWPSYSEAFNKKDYSWISKTFARSLAICFTCNLLITLILIIYFKELTVLWLGSPIALENELLYLMATWSLLTVFGGNLSSLFNGLNIIKFQVVSASTMTIANIILSIYFVKNYGISGPILASIISLIVFIYIPSFYYIYIRYDAIKFK